MRVSKLAAAAFGAALALGQVAQAQDYGRAFDQLRADQSRGDAVSLRWSTALNSPTQADASGRLSLRLSQFSGEETRNIDVLSYSFAAPTGARLSSPFRLNANDDGSGAGGWISSHKLLVGAGVALAIWGVVEATQDDNHHTSGQCITTC